jgi:opacity protein-like surface antigen
MLMVRRLLASGAMVLACSGAALAQDVVIGGNIGGFLVRNEESRDRDDVLRNNRTFLVFEIDEFDSTTFGGDFSVSLGSFVELGVGLNYTQTTVPSINDEFVDEDGTEIFMEMKQKIVPLALTAKLFPFTRDAKVQPYLGGGVQFNRWQYTEVGEFLDYDTGEIFRDSFKDDGVETGPVFLAGVRFPLGNNMLMGGEWRYATAKADLDPSLGFFGDTLDLGGHTWLFTVAYKFK